MNDFSITTRISTKDYSKAMIILLYKKPGFLIATALGLYYSVTCILYYSKVIDWYSDTPTFEIFSGAFLLLAPPFIVLIAVNSFVSNPEFQKDITYTFSETGISCNGTTFKSEFLWAHIIKQKEAGKFLILYHNSKAGNFIDKTKLTEEQLDFIRSKVESK